MTTQLFKQACWLHLSRIITRYLMSNTPGRMDGVEKALRHMELCTFYVAAARGIADLDMVRRTNEDDFQAVHTITQALTDNLDEEIGFPLTGRPDYNALAPLFFERFHELAMRALTGGEPAGHTDTERLAYMTTHGLTIEGQPGDWYVRRWFGPIAALEADLGTDGYHIASGKTHAECIDNAIDGRWTSIG